MWSEEQYRLVDLSLDDLLRAASVLSQVYKNIYLGSDPDSRQAVLNKITEVVGRIDIIDSPEYESKTKVPTHTVITYDGKTYVEVINPEHVIGDNDIAFHPNSPEGWFYPSRTKGLTLRIASANGMATRVATLLKD